MAAAVKKINRDANDHPDDEPRPSVGGQAGHQKNAEADAERGDEPERRHAERAMDLRVGEAEDKNSGADNREREQRADGNELAEQPDGKKPGDEHGDRSGEDLGDPGRAKFRMHGAENRRQQAVLGHRVKNSRLAEQHHEDDG